MRGNKSFKVLVVNKGNNPVGVGKPTINGENRQDYKRIINKNDILRRKRQILVWGWSRMGELGEVT